MDNDERLGLVGKIDIWLETMNLQTTSTDIVDLKAILEFLGKNATADAISVTNFYEYVRFGKLLCSESNKKLTNIFGKYLAYKQNEPKIAREFILNAKDKMISNYERYIYTQFLSSEGLDVDHT